MRHKYRANALMEYGLAGTLLVVAAIGIVLGLGNQLNEWLDGLKGDMTRSTAAAGQPRPIRSPAPAPVIQDPTPVAPQPQAVIPVYVPPPAAGQEQVCLSGKYCLNVPVVADTQVTTSGTNGNGQLTQEFAGVIAQMAEQLKQDPAADPAMVRMITELANKGHALGDYQKNLAGKSYDSTQQACSGHGVLGCQCTRMGCTKSVSPKEKAKADLAHLQQTLGPEFERQYQSIEAYLAANPNALSPELKRLLDLETGQIKTIIHGYQPDAMRMDEKRIPLGRAGFKTSYTLQDVANNAELTRQDSNTICQGGGRSDRCYRR